MATKLLLLLGAFLGFAIAVNWTFWLLHQPNQVAVIAGPLFGFLATSAFIRIVKIIFSHSGDS